MENTKDTIKEFTHLADFWLGDDYMQNFFSSMLDKDINTLTSNQKNYFLDASKKLIIKFQKESKNNAKVMSDLKDYFICYRDNIKPILEK